MTQIGEIEQITQDRIVTLFQHQLHYRYLGNWKDRENNSHIERTYLEAFLAKKKYKPGIIKKAADALIKTASNQAKDLYYVNRDVYSLLRYGVNAKEDAPQKKQMVQVIDWINPEANDFAIAEEVAIQGRNNKRPDIVLYVNGIALAVLELKRSTVSVLEGIRQNLDNQQKDFIRPFFATIQLIMAGNDSEGLRYGTIETKDKYYLTWKEESDMENKNTLDRHLVQLCEKNRILELIHDFICFDRGIKKLCRPHQYFGVKAAQESLRKREGGIIWHTQGSGKSLVMVWLTRWIRENIPDSRVLIITDRDELDKQIEKVFIGVEEKEIKRTSSGKDLLEKLNNTFPWLLCSLIHKFGRKEETDYDDYLDQLKYNLPRNFKPKGDIYVFIDECHRTQSGKLHIALKKILPNAVFIGFTGTPLLKKDKKTSLEIFGKYIHTYKFNEAVADKVILDLRCEARDIEQYITSPTKIDQWFEAKTKGLTQLAAARLKQKWGTMKSLLSSQSRLEGIVADIMLDMERKPRLINGSGNALLVSGSIYQACKYYELFQNRGFPRCAIITSYVPNIADTKGESTGEDSPTDKVKKYKIYEKMLNGKTVDEFEEEVKKKFIEEPAQMKLLIVVDKLLTGFDAPPATYLYIDKSMQDHSLFQAICRVNRLDTPDKEYGCIIDYKDLFKNLEKSIKDYTSEAFDAYDKTDIDGLLSDRLKKGKEQLDQALETIKALCEPVPPPKEPENYYAYFSATDRDNKTQLKENQPKRIAFYKHTASLIRAYADIANEMTEAGYSPSEITSIKNDVRYYDDLRAQIQIHSGDFIDLKSYEHAMRHLIDTYIGAEESEKIFAFDDLTLIDLLIKKGPSAIDHFSTSISKNPKSTAETIENNLRKLIIDETPTNPKYYEKMSALLDEIIQERKRAAIEYKKYLDTIIGLSKKVKNPSASAIYPKNINTNALRALYDNLGQNEELSISIDNAIRTTKKDSWRGDLIKTREVKYAIMKHLDDKEKTGEILEIVKKQQEY